MNERNRHGGRRDHDNRPRSQERAAAPAISQEEIQKILQHSAEDIDQSARKVAQACKDLAKTQIRNFYGPMVRLRSDIAGPQTEPLRSGYARALYMHAARLAYMAARNEKARPLENCFTQLVRAAVKSNRVDDDKLHAICDFAEAVVAYHYYSREEEPS